MFCSGSMKINRSTSHSTNLTIFYHKYFILPNCYNVLMITVGIDEVGRGCWAGPLVAGAVVLREPISGLKDSKKLSKKRREELALEIQACAAAIGLGWVQPAEI